MSENDQATRRVDSRPLWYSKKKLFTCSSSRKRPLASANGQDSTPLVKQKMLNGYHHHHHKSAAGAGDNLSDSPVATLSNMGNTCFLNSVLYALRFTPSFLHNLHHLVDDLTSISNCKAQIKAKTSSLGRNIGTLQGSNSRSTSSKDLLTIHTQEPKKKVQIVTEKLHELFITMHSLEIKDCDDAYQPLAFLQAVREANYIFEGNHQQDAHELLLYLLDNIRDTCEMVGKSVVLPNKKAGNENVAPSTLPTQPQNSGKPWRRSWKNNCKLKIDKIVCRKTINESDELVGEPESEDCSSVDGNEENKVEEGASLDKEEEARIKVNFINEDFRGITLRRTKCLECESITERKEPFYDISVPISTIKDTETDSTSCEIYRQACVTSEKLCDLNKFFCDKCMRYNEATREVLFESLPNIMVLQLKRFSTTLAGVQKVNSFMPTPLEIKCFCENCTKNDSGTPLHHYQLCCVIMHLGATMASGHYIAYVRAGRDPPDSLVDCPRDQNRTNPTNGSLSASTSEKSLNFLKIFKSRTISSSSFLDPTKNIMKSTIEGPKLCSLVDCCTVKTNENVIENSLNHTNSKNGLYNGHNGPTWHYSTSNEVWLECDDENVRAISRSDLEKELGHKPNSTSTPYLLFYSKFQD